jgi:hypothetical protein
MHIIDAHAHITSGWEELGIGVGKVQTAGIGDPARALAGWENARRLLQLA